MNMRQYIVLTNVCNISSECVDGYFQMFKAKDFKDCCIQYLKYIGDLDDVVQQGFNAFDNSEWNKILAYTNKFIRDDGDKIWDIVVADYFITNHNSELTK